MTTENIKLARIALQGQKQDLVWRLEYAKGNRDRYHKLLKEQQDICKDLEERIAKIQASMDELLELAKGT